MKSQSFARFILLSALFLLSRLEMCSGKYRHHHRPKLHETGTSININTDFRFTNQPGKCIALPFNQTVTKRGCLPAVIPNNMCFGTCGSMYIPHGDPLIPNKTLKDNTFFDCRHCIPEKYQLIRVPMYCPGRKRKHRTKKVLLIQSCTCISRKCLIHKK